MLIVGSSLNKNLQSEVIHHVTDSNVTFATTYTVDKDGNALYPNKNYMSIVPQELNKQNFETLILNCSPNDISKKGSSIFTKIV